MTHAEIMLKESLKWQVYKRKKATIKANKIKFRKPYGHLIDSHSGSDKYAALTAIYNNLNEN